MKVFHYNLVLIFRGHIRDVVEVCFDGLRSKLEIKERITITKRMVVAEKIFSVGRLYRIEGHEAFAGMFRMKITSSPLVSSAL